jgi:hypothetical protein
VATRITLNGKAGLMNAKDRKVCLLPDNCKLIEASEHQNDFSVLDLKTGQEIELFWRQLSARDRISLTVAASIAPQ